MYSENVHDMRRHLLLIFLPLRWCLLKLLKPISKGVGTERPETLEESLAIFQQLLKPIDRGSLYLTNTAYLLCKAGNRETVDENGSHISAKREYLSEKAIAL